MKLLSVFSSYAHLVEGRSGHTLENLTVSVSTLAMVGVWWLVSSRWSALRQILSFLKRRLPGQLHEVWSQSVGVEGPYTSTEVAGAKREHYSRFVRIKLPWLSALYIAPRPGWTIWAANHKDMLRHLSAKFVPGNAEYVAVVEAPLLARLFLRTPWQAVGDRTQSQVSTKHLSVAAKRTKLRFGEIVLGLDAFGDAVIVDCLGPLLTLAGTTRTGKSTLLYSLIAQASMVRELRLTIVDLSKIFSKKKYPGAKIIHTIHEVDAHLSKLEKLQVHRQAILSEAGLDDVRRLPHCPVPYLTIIDEGGLLFSKVRASDSKSASDQEKLYYDVQKRFNELATTSGKTLIATVVSFATPLQSEISMRFSSSAVKLATYIAQESVADAYGDKSILFDPALVGGRFAIFGASVGDQGWRVARALDRPELAKLTHTPASFLDDLDAAMGLVSKEATTPSDTLISSTIATDDPTTVVPAAAVGPHGPSGSGERGRS